MYVAHNVTIEFGAAPRGAGGSPGAIQGPVTSGSADGVSYSRDSRAAWTRTRATGI
jgi:hypothetical protein